MIYLPYDEIIEKITSGSSLSKAEIENRINGKMSQLSGLVSREGAAHIIANELGIKLFEMPSKLKISNLAVGLRNIELVGRVNQVFGKRDFVKENRSGTVANFVLTDETASVRVVIWGSKAETVDKLSEGMVVKLINAYVKDNNGRKEAHLNDKSEIVINPSGEILAEEFARKSIKELKENDFNVEIFGTIVQVFGLIFFEVCPACGKRVRQKESGFVCDVHGAVQQSYSYLINLIVDDGTEPVRVVFFRKQVESILKKNYEEILLFKENPEFFNEAKSTLLGCFIKLRGKVVKNTMFERLEFVPNESFLNPEPEDELKRVKKVSENEKSNDYSEPIIEDI